MSIHALRPFAVGLAVVVVMTSATAPHAQQSGTAAERQACISDVFKFCSAYLFEDEKIIVACLKKNTKRLSPACAKVFAR